MKVYVDEMPKVCDECPCLCDYEYGQCCNLDESIDTYKNVIPEKCNLKLLADHDKEVRKQVCDEIREILNSLYQFNDEKDKRYIEGFADGTNICLDQIKVYLDQIEKELNNE